MNNEVKTSFTFNEERIDADRYTNDLQNCINNLKNLIDNASDYRVNGADEGEQYPIWEYVTEENSGTLFYTIANLIKSCLEPDNYKELNELIIEMNSME